ncbi:NADH-quinone oxidoreductase subunit K [Rickettsiales endosymbiont of Paramecium tredecaurelia]|uniref:NADH-quinone oxidoreductase subunit NuoK n=1 Tax=Candidatus Sarmatiella mevalonica TaxID=2770581 RepID=UPI00192269AD|nr:NADH-quinone oxidoreductase subunit NuoK [Candidatus Sarmatiella mevalonica]MBL3285148.1 NADH-quinone oxidoreductase subunit K [Candidatus Sarmatiella mevalonica]
MKIDLSHYLFLSCAMFILGLMGAMLRNRSILTLLMSVELILLAANINFVAFAVYLKEISGQIFSLFVLGLTAAETAIALAIIIVYFKTHNSTYLKKSKD